MQDLDTTFTNFDDGTPAPSISDSRGNERKLGLILSSNPLTSLPRLTSIPGYRQWTKQEIEDAIRTKPKKVREVFKGDAWIENQEQRGSCCPTATTAAGRKAAYYAGLNDVPRLSAEFLYAQVNRGQDNGALLDETQQAAGTIGWIVRDDRKHPFNRDIYKNNYSPEEYRDALLRRAGASYQIDSELDLATFLLSRAGGAVVAVDVDNSFMKLDRYGFAGGGRGPGNHAVDVDDVEIINGELSFDMANSWGLDYGDEGRAYVSWNRHFNNTHRYHKFFVIVGCNFADLRSEGPAVK